VDDGTCIYAIVEDDCEAGGIACSEGMYWNPILQKCLLIACENCVGDLNGDTAITTSDLLIFLGVFGLDCLAGGCTDESALNFNPDAGFNDGSCVFSDCGAALPGDLCDDNDDWTYFDVVDSTACNCAGTPNVNLDGSGPCAGQTFVTYNSRDYLLVEIGNQCWFQDNLATWTYANGDSIVQGFQGDGWGSTVVGAMAIYSELENCTHESPTVNACDSAQVFESFGALYNWYAATDERGLCPLGWHVPSDEEWMLLEMELGMDEFVTSQTGWRGTSEGEMLKSPSGWMGNGSNASGFAALPGGVIYPNGWGNNAGAYGFWWSTSSFSANGAWDRRLSNGEQIGREYGNRQTGQSVRCLKGMPGCTDPEACNFLPEATEENGSCMYLESTCYEDWFLALPTAMSLDCLSEVEDVLSTTLALPESQDCCTSDIARSGIVGIHNMSLAFDCTSFEPIQDQTACAGEAPTVLTLSGFADAGLAPSDEFVPAGWSGDLDIVLERYTNFDLFDDVFGMSSDVDWMHGTLVNRLDPAVTLSVDFHFQVSGSLGETASIVPVISHATLVATGEKLVIAGSAPAAYGSWYGPSFSLSGMDEWPTLTWEGLVAGEIRSGEAVFIPPTSASGVTAIDDIGERLRVVHAHWNPLQGEYQHVTTDGHILNSQPPVILSGPEDVTVACDEVPAPLGPEAIEAIGFCGGDVTVVAQPEVMIPGDCPNEYIIFRNWNVSDNVGNLSVHTQVIHVVDASPPLAIASYQDTIVVESPVVDCALNLDLLDLPNQIEVWVQDDCSGGVPYTLATSDEWVADSTCSTSGTLIRTYMVQSVDECGNMLDTAFTQWLLVQDTTPPEIWDIEFDYACGDNWTSLAASHFDLCEDDAASIDPYIETLAACICMGAGLSCFPTKHLTFRAQDGCGNESVAQALATYIDTVPPVIVNSGGLVNGQELQVPCGGEVPPPVNLQAVDACSDGSEVFVDMDESILYIDMEAGGGYLIQRDYQISDCDGNLTLFGYSILVGDFDPPSLNVALPAYTVACGDAYPEPLIEASDNCGDVVVDLSLEFSGDGSCASVQTGTWTVVATDMNGNSTVATVSFVVLPESAVECGNPVSYQGYDYATVLIGEQCWFAENLRSENYENGDAIPSNLSDSEWSSTTSGAVAVYGEGSSTCYNDSPNGDACDEAWSLNQYGRLYNWYAVDDARGLCPSGWHVPTDGEWMTMEMALGMSEADANDTGWRGTDQGAQMKTDYGWHDGGNGTNASGFSGQPGGSRGSDGSFYNAGLNGRGWSSSPIGSNAWYRYLKFEFDHVGRIDGDLHYGFSVRCVRDAE